MRKLLKTLCGVCMFGAVSVHAQRASRANMLPAPSLSAAGSINGVVFDSLSMRVIEHATVTLFRTSRSTYSDAHGRFHFANVQEGAEDVAFFVPELDSLGLGTLGSHAIVVGGQTTELALATPSLRTLWSYHCNTNNVVGEDSALVWGSIRDALTDSLLSGAAAGFQWISVKPGNAKGLSIREVQKQVETDAMGNYFACGLPMNVPIYSGATAARSASGRVGYAIGTRRLQRLDLTVSNDMIVVEPDTTLPIATGNRARAAQDTNTVARSAENTNSAARPAATAQLTGTVVDDKSRPVANATVIMDVASGPTMTDSVGHFTFTRLPGGTQSLTVRQIGRLQIDQIVQLKPFTTTAVTIVMSSANALTAINIRAKSANRLGYENRRERNLGMALDSTILNHRSDLAELLKQMPDVQLKKGDLFTEVVVRPLIPSHGAVGKCVGSNVFLDGIPVPFDAIQSYKPSDIRAIELLQYEVVPLEYDTGVGCGAVLVWTKRYKW